MGRWTPDDHGCIYDEAGCFARLTPNKAERLASRHNADIDALETEIAELKSTDHYQRCLDEMHLRYNVEAELTRYREAHAQLVIDYEQVLADLEQSDNTLDALREVGIDPSYHGNPADWANEDKLDTLIQFQAILYPPETTNDNG